MGAGTSQSLELEIPSTTSDSSGTCTEASQLNKPILAYRGEKNLDWLTCKDCPSAVYVRNHFVDFTTLLGREFVPAAACSLYILDRAYTLREEISHDGINYDFAERNC